MRKEIHQEKLVGSDQLEFNMDFANLIKELMVFFLLPSKKRQALETLLTMHKKIKTDPSSKKLRLLRIESYDFIVKYLGPLERYCTYHRSIKSYSILSADIKIEEANTWFISDFNNDIENIIEQEIKEINDTKLKYFSIIFLIILSCIGIIALFFIPKILISTIIQLITWFKK